MTNARLYKAKDINSANIPKELLKQSADVEYFIFDVFGINEARELKIRAYQKPVVRETHDFLIHFKSITIESQNALLKLLEDSPETSVFHIVVQHEELLLSTVRSRLLMCLESKIEICRDDIRTFLKLKYVDRMEEIKKRVKAKDDKWIESIMAGAEEFAVHQKKIKRYKALKDVLFVRRYFGTRGASNKMLLEELSLSL